MLGMIIILTEFITMTSSTAAADALTTLLAQGFHPSRRPIAVLCAKCNDCPVIALDETAPEEKRVVITDDFGQEIQMSVEQFQVLLELAQSGAIVL
jgi:hypothetical protein